MYFDFGTFFAYIQKKLKVFLGYADKEDVDITKERFLWLECRLAD